MLLFAAFRISKRWMQNSPMKFFSTTYGISSLYPARILNDVFGVGKRNATSKAGNEQKDSKAKIQNDSPQSCLKDDLLCKLTEPVQDARNKVTIVGSGMAGVACAYALLFQRITSHIAIVDAFPKKLEGEGMDLCHGSVFLNNPRIEYDTDFCVTKDSKVIIVTSGARQKKGENRLDLIQKNTDILKNIIPPLVEHSPKAVFIIFTNPVDILSWVTWKVSSLPINQIMGSGTHLDSARFRYMIASRIGVAPSSVHAYIIGEHGDSQVPLWSGVNIAGVQFRDVLSNIGLETDEENWKEVSNDVVKCGPTVRCLKGYSNTAAGLAVADLTNAILRNSQEIKTVSTLMQGHYDINHEVFLSIPCVLGENGITHVVRQRMTESEKKLLQTSANIIQNVQKNIKI